MAIIQVDHRAVRGEFIAHRGPEVFVLRDFGRGTIGGRGGCGKGAA